jgi:hypothetical protein
MTHSIDENTVKGADKSFFFAVPEYYFSAEFRSVPSFGMGFSAEFGIPLELALFSAE